MVAPEARLKMYDKIKPSEVRIIPSIVAKIINFRSLYVYCLLIAAGIVNKAIRSITPTTFIRTTTLKATKAKRSM